jgi:hypothetical protein
MRLLAGDSHQNTIPQVIKNLVITSNAIVTAVKWTRPGNDQQARFHSFPPSAMGNLFSAYGSEYATKDVAIQEKKNEASFGGNRQLITPIF